MPIDPRAARSWLFVPGDQPRKIAKSLECGADAVIVDLEDAVGPENKVSARDIVRRALDEAGAARAGTLVVIRVNSRDTGMTDDDIAATFGCRPDGYMLPKVMTPEDIVVTADRIGALGTGQGSDTFLVPIVTESPVPVLRLPELCAASPRSAAILWGSEDLSAAIGARRVKDAEGRMLEVFRAVRSMALLAGSAAGLGVIDTPVIDFHNDEELRREAVEAYWMGFTGKLAIHPRQVPIINDAFTPTADEIDDARAIASGAEKSGGGAFRLGNRMIDLPHIRAAERIVALDRMLRARQAEAGAPS